jgi:D-inositol-3-phosphate glycosyltransferase
MRVGGLREAVVDGTTGLLADNPIELTAAIRRLLDNAEEREQMARAGLERSWNFNWERTAALTIGVLRGAIADSKKAGAKL